MRAWVRWLVPFEIVALLARRWSTGNYITEGKEKYKYYRVSDKYSIIHITKEQRTKYKDEWEKN